MLQERRARAIREVAASRRGPDLTPPRAGAFHRRGLETLRRDRRAARPGGDARLPRAPRRRRRAGRVVGDLPRGAARLPAAAPAQQRARLARHDRPAQGDRPAARAPARAAPGLGPRRTRRAGERAGAARLRGAAPRARRARAQAARRRRLPLPRRPPLRRGRPPARLQRGRRAPQRGRRHRPPAPERRKGDAMRTREITDALRAAYPAESGDLERLAARAERAGLLDVAWRTCESPFGPLLLAAT